MRKSNREGKYEKKYIICMFRNAIIKTLHFVKSIYVSKTNFLKCGNMVVEGSRH
jgi:hypothetical protein